MKILFKAKGIFFARIHDHFPLPFVGLFIGRKTGLPAVGHLTDDDAFYSFAYCFGTFLPFVMALFMGPPYVSVFIGVLPIVGHKFDYFSGQDYDDFRRPLGCQLALVEMLIKFPLHPHNRRSIFNRDFPLNCITHTPHGPPAAYGFHIDGSVRRFIIDFSTGPRAG